MVQRRSGRFVTSTYSREPGTVTKIIQDLKWQTLETRRKAILLVCSAICITQILLCKRQPLCTGWKLVISAKFTIKSKTRAPDKLRICVFYAMKTSENACIIRSECTHYAYILLCKQTFQIIHVLAHFQRTTCSQIYFHFSSYLLHKPLLRRSTAFICNIGHYAYILMCKQTFQIWSLLVRW
jgi:hypothetical protein